MSPSPPLTDPPDGKTSEGSVQPMLGGKIGLGVTSRWGKPGGAPLGIFGALLGIARERAFQAPMAAACHFPCPDGPQPGVSLTLKAQGHEPYQPPTLRPPFPRVPAHHLGVGAFEQSNSSLPLVARSHLARGLSIAQPLHGTHPQDMSR